MYVPICYWAALCVLHVHGEAARNQASTEGGVAVINAVKRFRAYASVL